MIPSCNGCDRVCNVLNDAGQCIDCFKAGNPDKQYVMTEQGLMEVPQ